jgi:Protein of unknown function (DUF2958)
MVPSNEDDLPPEDVSGILREQAEDEAHARTLAEQARTLLPPEIAERLPPLYSQEDRGDGAIALVKLFTPWTSWTWYVSEYDPEQRLCFGVVVGREREFGYFSLDELQGIRGPGGLTIERDLYWKPRPLKECR